MGKTKLAYCCILPMAWEKQSLHPAALLVFNSTRMLEVELNLRSGQYTWVNIVNGPNNLGMTCSGRKEENREKSRKGMEWYCLIRRISPHGYAC